VRVPRVSPLALTVSGYQYRFGTLTLGNNLQSQIGVSVPGPFTAPAPAITITSSDPSRLLISTTATQSGRGSVTIQPDNYYTTVYLQALSDSGDVEISASIPSGALGKGLVHLVPSGLGWSSQVGTVALDRITVQLDRVATAYVTAFALDPVNLTPIAAQS